MTQQFCWHNLSQTSSPEHFCISQQQQGNRSCNEEMSWSQIGLSNDSRDPQQMQETGWSRGEQLQPEIDPYSAAAFGGFSAQPNSATALWHSVVNERYGTSAARTMQNPAKSEVTRSDDFFSNVPLPNDSGYGACQSPLIGVHQPMLVMQSQKAKNASTQPTVVAVAQVTPILATSPTNIPDESAQLSHNVLSSGLVNVARVGPISNQQSDARDFSMNRVAPTPRSTELVTDDDTAFENHSLVTEVISDANRVDSANATTTITNELSTINPNLSPDTLNTLHITKANCNSVDAIPELLSHETSSIDVLDGSVISNVGLISDSSRPKRVQQATTCNETSGDCVIQSSTDLSADSAMNCENGFAGKSKKNTVNSKSVRERYRSIRKQYPEVVKRLDRIKMEAHGLQYHSLSKVDDSDAANGGTFTSIGEDSRAFKSKETKRDTVYAVRQPEFEHVDFRPYSKLNHSYTVPERVFPDNGFLRAENTCYGDDFVSSLRRTRLARAREHDPFYAARGTKSEMGEIGPYRGPAAALHRQYTQRSIERNMPIGYGVQEFYANGRQSVEPLIGLHAAGTQEFENRSYALRRRPQSTFDAVSMSRYQRSDSFDQFLRDEYTKSDGESSNDDEEYNASDDEVARIHREKQMMRRGAANIRYDSLAANGLNEFYYFGVIQLSQERVRRILHRNPPPMEYVNLPPIEKAAYLFYCSLYQHHYEPVDLFHKKFNREFFSYTCEGDSSELALWKICKHTQDEFSVKRSNNKLKAYEMSQKQLFSDDRETLDSRQSERGSKFDVEEESDRLSVDSSSKEPLKFRCPHSFLQFGVGGKAVMLNVRKSENVVEICDWKSLIVDQKLVQLTTIIESFRGPLIAGNTPPHSVLLYVQRRIDSIRHSETYIANPLNGAVADVLLIWQLLEILVQQQGRVTGPDLSRLLVTGCRLSRDSRVSNSKDSPISISPLLDERVINPKVYDNFTMLLLGGHIKEALEFAMKNGLYSDAMILARRIYQGNSKELERIETAFLSHRSEHNPVMTLFSVANGVPAPILTSPPIEDSNGWRLHAAMVLANLDSSDALGTVFQLGRVLSHRQQHSAADFCFLAVNLLSAGYNPFQPLSEGDKESYVERQHITLIHASVEEDIRIGGSNRFSVIDLHATEIFEFATILANNCQPVHLSESIAYQISRIDYAEIVSEYAGLSADAFQYCVEVAKGLWKRLNQVDIAKLRDLCNLSDRLKYVSCADARELLWFSSIQSVINDEKAVKSKMDMKRDINTPESLQEFSDNGLTMIVNSEIPAEKKSVKSEPELEIKRALSIDSEAINWHANRQDPICMSKGNDHTTELLRQEARVNSNVIDTNQLRSVRPTAHRNRTLSGTDKLMKDPNYSSFPPSIPIDKEQSDVLSNSSTNRVRSVLPELNAEVSASLTDTIQEGRDLKNSTRSEVSNFHSSRSISVNGPVSAYDRSDSQTGATPDSATNTSISCESSLQKRLQMDLNLTGKSGVVSDSSIVHNRTNTVIGSVLVNKIEFEGRPIIPHSQSTSAVQQMQSRKEMKTVDTEKAKDDMGSMSGLTGSGLFGKIKAKIAKAIPSNNEMILPDDKNPAIVWDPKLNRYIGAGIQEVNVTEPPPSTSSSFQFNGSSSHGSTGGLTAARLSGGSRYFNPLIEIVSNAPVLQSSPKVPTIPLPASFGFIPSMPESDEEVGESPFSINTAPHPVETEVIQ